MLLTWIPTDLLKLIYQYLDNPLHRVSFRLVCDAFYQAVAKQEPKVVIKLIIHFQPTSSIEFFEWMRTICPIVRLEHLTMSNNLALIKYAIETLNWKLDIDKSYPTSSLPCLQYLSTQQNFQWTRCCIVYAAEKGSIDCLRCVYKHGCPLDSNVFYAAASNGHLEVVQCLHQMGCPYDEDIFDSAAYRGYLEIIRYLHQAGFRWSGLTFYYACIAGHLEVVKYLYTNGCQRTLWICETAIEYGHLEILKYLLQAGCTWNRQACIKLAESNGRIEILNWIQQNTI